MKKYLFLAATAMMFAACTNNEVDAPKVTTETQQPVAFDIYMSDATRAYTSGVMTTELLGNPGFGVFAYHNLGDATNAGTYNPAGTPNFMYNQNVTYSTAWTYTPIKYWPNETGTDMYGATGAAYSGTVATPTKKDVLSFFAYAPYVAAGSGTKGTDAGINAMVANTGTTDPFVTYTISKVPSGSVDLVWGVAPAGGLSYTAVNNDAISIDEGLPLQDLVKPSKDQKIKFLFQHALARIGMTVVAAVDQIAPGGTLDDTNTKIYVNSITLADNAHTIPTYGDLNLNNTSAGVAKWINTNAASANFSVTINASNELNTDLQNISGKPGVTTKETKVIAQAGTPLKDQYLMLIPTPGTDAVFNVTIDYDVITTDANLNGGKSTVNNVITKQITLSSTNTFDNTVTGFINNKAYNLKLILGMTSVKLDAEVADWEVDGSTNVNLPKNEE